MSVSELCQELMAEKEPVSLSLTGQSLGLPPIKEVSKGATADLPGADQGSCALTQDKLPYTG